MQKALTAAYLATKLQDLVCWPFRYLPSRLGFFEELEVGLDPATDFVETGLPRAAVLKSEVDE